MLIEARAVLKKAHKDDRKSTLETTVADSIKETAHWKDTKLHLYEQYKAETITREDYVAQIEKGKIRMEELDSLQAVSEPEEIPDEKLAEFSVLESFDKDRLKILIDKVIVYGADAIEIVWKVGNPFKAEIDA